MDDQYPPPRAKARDRRPPGWLRGSSSICSRWCAKEPTPPPPYPLAPTLPRPAARTRSRPTTSAPRGARTAPTMRRPRRSSRRRVGRRRPRPPAARAEGVRRGAHRAHAAPEAPARGSRVRGDAGPPGAENLPARRCDDGKEGSPPEPSPPTALRTEATPDACSGEPGQFLGDDIGESVGSFSLPPGLAARPARALRAARRALSAAADADTPPTCRPLMSRSWRGRSPGGARCPCPR